MTGELIMGIDTSNYTTSIAVCDIDGNIVYANTAAVEFCAADDSIKTLEEQLKVWKCNDIKDTNSIHIWEMTRRNRKETHYYTIEYRRIYDSIMKSLGYFFLIHDKNAKLPEVKIVDLKEEMAAKNTL